MATMQEAVRRLTVSAEARGVSETIGKVQDLGKAFGGVTVASQGTERATISMEKRLAQIQGRLDPFIRRQQATAKLERELTAARQQGLITLERQNQLLAMQAAQLDLTASASARLSGFARAGSFIGGLASGFAIGELMRLPSVISGIVDEAAKMVEAAARIGITTERLQELHYSAKLAEVETGELDKAMQIFARNLGTALTGTGDLAKVLKLNGVALRDQSGAVISVNTQFDRYADLIKNAGSEQERLKLGQIGFSRSGAVMVSVLKDGSAALREQGEQIEKVSDKILRRSAEIDDKFDKLATTLETRFKKGVLSGVSVLDQYIDKLDELIRRAQDSNLGRLMGWAYYAGTQLRGIAGSSGMSVATGVSAGTGRSASASFAPRTRLPAETDDAAAKAQQQYDRATASIERQIAAMKIEAAAFGMTEAAAASYRIKQQLLNAAKEAGISLSASEKAALGDLASRYAAQASALDQMKERYQQIEDVARTVTGNMGRAFDEFIETGKINFSGFVDSLLKDLARLAMQEAILGPLTKSLTSSLGGLFGNGVSLGAPLTGWDAVVMHQGGTVGQGNATRYVHKAYFDDAPRYHGGGVAGLRPNEVPAILERGERITPRGAGAPVAEVKFEIINKTGQNVEAREGERSTGPGGVRIQEIILETVNRGVVAGKLDQSMGLRFGASRRTTTR